jgi:hypothetical protein
MTFTSEGSPPTAKLMLAERGMGEQWFFSGYPTQYEFMWFHAAGPNAPFTNTSPHRARALEYVCDPATGNWALVGNSTNNALLQFQVGNGSVSNAGGTDFDFDARGCSGPNLGNRVWFTADYMASAPWYGVTGIPLSGGSLANSIVVDLNGVAGSQDKATVGDIEIPCPPHGQVSGRVRLQGFDASQAGIVAHATFCQSGAAIAMATGSMDADGDVTFECNLADGDYFVLLQARSNLVKKTHFLLVNGVGTFESVTLLTGDISQDNTVDIGDYSLLSSAFGSTAGQPQYLSLADLNGDLEIDIADYALLSQNFGLSGDPLP